MAQGGTEVDGVADGDIQRVEGPSAPYGEDSWDNPMVGEDTALDGAGPVREAVERRMETAQAGVVTDMWEAEDKHPGDFQMKYAR